MCGHEIWLAFLRQHLTERFYSNCPAFPSSVSVLQKSSEYNFYGRAIDATSEMVTLKSYEDDKTIEVSIDKLKDEHREQIAESFDEYIKAVAAWTEKRRPAEELVDSRRAELDHLLALEAQAQAEIEAREEAEREREKAIARVRRQDAERKARREKIERSFGIWNGDHTGLTKYIKNRMNNPSSFQHVSTSYSDQGNYLVVFMVYRGSNAFGGIVTKEVSARVDLEGNVLEILTIE